MSVAVAKSSKFAVFLLFTIFLSILGLSFFVFKKNSYIENLIKNKSTIGSSLKNIESKLEKRKVYLDRKKELQKDFFKLNSFASFGEKNLLNNFLVDVANGLPEETFLSELVIKKEITVKGFSNSVKNVLNLLTNISHLPYVDSGRVVKIKRESLDTPFIEFLLDFKIKPLREDNAKNKKTSFARS